MSKTNMKETHTKKKNRPKKRKNKLVLLFDENARREFLTGFHKRKMQRKIKAKEDFEKQLKIERKRIKAEAKEQYKKLLFSKKPVPEFSDILSQNVDMGTHSVTVTELSAADLAKRNCWIGINDVQHYEKTNEEDPEENEKEFIQNKNFKKDLNMKRLNDENSISYKELKRKIKQQAATNVQNSTIFKKKVKLEKIKNIKLKKKQEKAKKKLKRKQKNK